MTCHSITVVLCYLYQTWTTARVLRVYTEAPALTASTSTAAIVLKASSESPVRQVGQRPAVGIALITQNSVRWQHFLAPHIRRGVYCCANVATRDSIETLIGSEANLNEIKVKYGHTFIRLYCTLKCIQH